MESAIFVDSSFIIALVRKEDENNSRALELNKTISSKRVVSDLIISEVLTFIKFHDTLEKAYELGQRLMNLEDTAIMIPTTKDLDEALSILHKYKQLSFCDSTTIAQMRNSKINRVISFDADFDLIPGIERIY